MNQDEIRLDLKALSPDQHYGETLLYDFAKFYSTLSIFTAGNAGDGADASLFATLGLAAMVDEEPARVAAE